MTPNHLELKSADGTKLNLEALYRIAPSCFTEVKDEKTGELRHVVNFTTLRQLLGDDAVEDAPEMYQFTWPGKQEARREAARPITDTLRPCPEESVDWDTTQNLYIEGDNLAVLKLLQKGYMGKVKMIYIDPPYNTGNDFVYHDDFAVSQKEMDLFSGDVDEEGNRYRKNTDSNGRFHSDWCSMMYSRLLVARSLLCDKGVICISIDDNEVENLLKICDEIFGESQRLSDIIVKNNPRGRQSDSFVATVHEHLLCYGKDSSRSMLNGMPLSIEQQQDFSYEDENGKYRLLGLRQRGVASLREDRPDMFFPIYVSPDGNSISLDAKPDWSAVIPKKSDGREGRWMWGKTKCQEDIQRLVPKIIERRNEYDIFVKDYLNREGEVRTRKFQSIWDDNTMNNQVGTQEVGALLGPNIMSFPKSRPYIQQVVQMGADNDSIILDFFSGSSTTAHAVMQLNAEDGGTRKYIMVQLQEETPDKSDARKAGYNTIPEIAKERIRRAGKKIKDEAGVLASTIDTGFRVLKLSGSNFNEVEFTPKEFTQDLLSGLESNIKEGRTDLDLLFGAMLDWGVQLSLPMSKETVDGCDIYTVNEGDLVACFSENITENVVSAMASKMPLRVLFRDSCFDDDKSKINVFELFKQKLDWGEDEAIKNIRVI